jgi:ParB family chromosome partitioning protein
MTNDKVAALLRVAGGSVSTQATAVRAAVHNIQRIPVGSIDPDPENARKAFDPAELQALADDIKIHGQTQNAIVFETAPGRFQLVAGERRWRACQLANVGTLVAMVLPRDMPKEQREDIAFAENLARAQLKPVEVARHWQRLMKRRGCSVRELAARVGVAPSTICKKLALLKLDVATQQAVDAGKVLQTAAIETTRTKRRRHNDGRRSPRGVHRLQSGTVRLKRGATLEQLAAELAAMVAANQAKAA